MTTGRPDCPTFCRQVRDEEVEAVERIVPAVIFHPLGGTDHDPRLMK
jgi:hypothetical protein